MNITIFGGTGKSGLLVLEKALAAGHKVTMYARNPEKINIQHKNLIVIKGELTEPNKIDEAVSGADAVISLLGPMGISRELVISNGMKNIIHAMQKMVFVGLWQQFRQVTEMQMTNFSFGLILVLLCLKLLGDHF